MGSRSMCIKWYYVERNDIAWCQLVFCGINSYYVVLNVAKGCLLYYGVGVNVGVVVGCEKHISGAKNGPIARCLIFPKPNRLLHRFNLSSSAAAVWPPWW